MTADILLFLILAVVSIASALAMLFSRNAIYSALFLILNFGTISVFYLLLGAPFLAMVQVTVYAGAIMVLFLFVIMLLGAEQLRSTQTIPWQQPLAFLLGAILLAETVYLFFTIGDQGAALPSITALVSDFGSPTAIGELLFNQYLLPFEVTSVLLLVAMVGAIVLTKSEKKAGDLRAAIERPLGNLPPE
ncbi:MAG TPA: NADH-quinone oxidoreductase subunit J [Anaerolineales bacterium]|nr:NADH-quinone oxidoreductase subunit J [Anaerolineales bacterium]